LYSVCTLKFGSKPFAVEGSQLAAFFRFPQTTNSKRD